MALQQRIGADHTAVVGIEGIGLDVLVVAQGVVVIQGVAEPQRVVHPIVQNPPTPFHGLLVEAILRVVVLEAGAIVDADLADEGTQHGCAPVRLVHILVLVFQCHRAAQLRCQVGQP